MSRRRILVAILGVAGLALYLWPALTAPVVLWSDSEIDLAWARAGQGIVTPAGTPGHAAKPGYLLFLRVALALGGGTPRGVVVFQSILVVGAIMVASFLVGRRYGLGFGTAFYALELFFLRTRDAASSVMSESLSAAIFLLVVVALLEPPRRRSALAALGLAVGFLFLVRPNVGAAAGLLAAARLAAERETWRGLAVFDATAAALVLPIWLATAGGSAAGTRGLAFQVLEASVDDLWTPELGRIFREGAPNDIARKWQREALSRWRATIARGGPDATRQIVWRLTHGLLGTEFYDATWSPAYRAFSTISRLAAPFLVLAAAGFLVALPWRGETGKLKTLGILLLALLLIQNLVIGSLPRYVLPMIPALLGLGLLAARALGRSSLPRLVLAAAMFLLAVAALRRFPSGLGWEWGRLAEAGERIAFRVPRAALPRSGPAVLHLRVAPSLLPTLADASIVDASGLVLPKVPSGSEPIRAELAVALPEGLLRANLDSDLDFELVATGDYGPVHYMLFPVIPRPFKGQARRLPSGELSPTTGIAAGGLDWWAHGPPIP